MWSNIRAGDVSELEKKNSEDWIFVDIGFSSTDRSCGVLKNEEEYQPKTFGQMVDYLKEEISKSSPHLNLVIDAPLSVAFKENGNPVGRRGEKRGSNSHRYWNENAGPLTLVATGFLMRALFECERHREVRLFEGFASFKSSTGGNSHEKDVKGLRRAAWNRSVHCVIPSSKLKVDDGHILESAFKFAGMDLGIPPVVFACEHDPGDPNCQQ